jgi:hypothetical protein
MNEQEKALKIILDFRDRLFFDESALSAAKQAYQNMVKEKIAGDLHLTST